MTTEQKEAIDRLNYINRAYDYNNYYSTYDLDCIDVVLNLIQEQEVELKRLDKEAQEYFETTIRQSKDFDSQLQKKDEIIDELAKAFKQDDVRTLEEIKQFYERKVEDEKI